MMATSNLEKNRFGKHDSVEILMRIIKLLDATGYTLVQNNGQRIFGPPPNWNHAEPGRGTEVFIGKLPRDCYEDELVPLFSKAGLIYEMRLMMDFSGMTRGYGFVKYASSFVANRAIDMFNKYEIRPNCKIGVVKSIDNRRLFVGNIPKEKTRDEVYDAMSKLVAKISRVILYSCPEDKTKNRGFAFIEFYSHRDAAMARRCLIPGKVRLWDVDVSVDWAQPEYEVDESIMENVKILYVRNLSMKTHETFLKQLFVDHAGEAEIVRLKKMKDFAFVHFKTRAVAEVVKEKLHGFSIDGVQIEIEWAKPPQKEEVLLEYHSNGLSHRRKNFCRSISPEPGTSADTDSNASNSIAPRYADNNKPPLYNQSWMNLRLIDMPIHNPHIRKEFTAISSLCHFNNIEPPMFQYMIRSDDAGNTVYFCVALMVKLQGYTYFYQSNGATSTLEEALYDCLLQIKNHFEQIFPQPRTLKNNTAIAITHAVPQ